MSTNSIRCLTVATTFYITIWPDRVRWPERTKKDRIDKIKMIIRINDYEKAAMPMAAFKDLKKAFKTEKLKKGTPTKRIANYRHCMG